ncbi:MAG: FAD-dependent thymidylate synthase [Myxococcota bacterium]
MSNAAPIEPSAPVQPFESASPVVRLVNTFAEPFNNAIATARTCYSSRVIEPHDVDKDDRARAQRDAIAQSTYEAGHHTTLQHAHFQFVLDNVSRQLIWSFLHAHPFYNSEQVSQRYVSVKADRLVVPKLAERDAALYAETAAAQMMCYRDLVGLLTEPVAEAYFEVFRGRRKKQDQYARDIKKKAQEVARYALPIATFAHLYHTVSGLTLHRYHRLSRAFDVPIETGAVITAMIAEVDRVDPLFFSHIEDPVPLEETHEYLALTATRGVHVSESARAFRDEFDRELGELSAKLLATKPNAEALMARAVRSVLGVASSELSDDAAIELVLSPVKNPYLTGALNLSSLGKLTRALVHPHFTFQKKLSHSADSQDQRHRMTPGTRPVLHAHYVGGEPDLVVPPMIRSNPPAFERFMATMRQTWHAIDTLLDGGVSPESALYLLPNAFPIRFEESGDLMAFHHKWTTRLCYNAQEEIWQSSVEEVVQVREAHPRIGRWIEPPCGLRRETAVRPYCPEGPRYCGVPAWKQDLADYHRVL